MCILISGNTPRARVDIGRAGESANFSLSLSLFLFFIFLFYVFILMKNDIQIVLGLGGRGQLVQGKKKKMTKNKI